MYEQQNFESLEGSVSPAKDLSADIFSEQVSQYQRNDAHVPRPSEIESQSDINEKLNNELNTDIYSSVGNSNDPAAEYLSGIRVEQLKGLQPKTNHFDSTVDPRTGILSGGSENGKSVEISPGRRSSQEDLPQTEEQKIAQAVDWAKQNFNRFDSHKDGLLEKWELDMPQLSGQASEHDLEMLKVLSEHKDKIKFAHIDDFDGRRGEGLDGITRKDLNVLDRHFEREMVFDNAEKESHDIAETLLQGDNSLFDFLDRASNGRNDGKIGKGDLERYLNDYEYLKKYGVDSGPYTPENVDAVNRMLETWDIDSFPGPGTRMRGILDADDIREQFFKKSRYKYITREKVVKAAGLG